MTMRDILRAIGLTLFIFIIIGSVIAIPIWFLWHHFVLMSIISVIGLLPSLLLIKILIEDC